jgi:hypothetical protein
MSLVSRAPGLVAASLLAWGCTVYDTGLTANNELMTSGTDAGGSSDKAGTSNDDGGKPANMAGTMNATGGVAPSGGTFGTAGTSEAGTTSDGGEAPTTGGTATAGSGGANAGADMGGKGGSGGTSAAGTSGTGGIGGSGGSAPVAKCADHPITPKATKWVATASTASLGNGMETDGLFNPPEHMTDALYNERWSSGKRQDGTEWIQIDFGASVNLTGVTLNVSNDTGDYPRHYEVRLTAAADPLFKGPILVQDDGMPGNTVILFKTMVTGRYLTIRQTLNVVDGPWWTIAEVLATCADP